MTDERDAHTSREVHSTMGSPWFRHCSHATDLWTLRAEAEKVAGLSESGGATYSPPSNVRP